MRFALSSLALVASALAACDGDTHAQPPQDAATDLHTRDATDVPIAEDILARDVVTHLDVRDVVADLAAPTDRADVSERDAAHDVVADLARDVATCAVACVGGRTCVAGRCEDAWRSVTMTDAPSPRSFPAWAWIGTELFVWGGQDGGTFFQDGARYDPTTNRWRAVSSAGAPSARSTAHTVWTGREVIVWGGRSAMGAANDGGRYDPATDTWRAISAVNAPIGRYDASAVWTGAEFIVWGGQGAGTFLGDGARYDPATDTWRAISMTDAPGARTAALSTWTGSEFFIWGGLGLSGALAQGARYQPATDTWRAVGTVNAPAARSTGACVWTGREVFLWGGFGGGTEPERGDGARYDPTTDTWTALSTTGAPPARADLVPVWTGREVFVWGGLYVDRSVMPSIVQRLNSGALYDPMRDAWRTVETLGAPSPRNGYAAVWTGHEIVVWGGSAVLSRVGTGARLQP